MQLKVHMQITGTPQGLLFKMKLIHITGVLQTAHIMAFMACLQCVVSRCSGLNVVTLTLRLLMSYIYIYIYIYGAPILDVFRSHTTTQHSQ